MLSVHTSTIRYRGPDRFDITRGSGGRDAHPFAPSWAILKPALEARRVADELRADAKRRDKIAVKQGFKGDIRRGSDSVVRMLTDDADKMEREAWGRYVPAFLAEMEHSQQHHPGAWTDLLARPRVVLCCYCPDVTKCHRGLVACILVQRGARWMGELWPDGRPRPVDGIMEAQ